MELVARKYCAIRDADGNLCAQVPTHLCLEFGLVKILLNVVHLFALLDEDLCSPACLIVR